MMVATMALHQYVGPGWLQSAAGETVAVVLTLSGDGPRWAGTAQPSGDGAVFPAWLRQVSVVTVRLVLGGRGQARLASVSLDLSQPVRLTGVGPWPE